MEGVISFLEGRKNIDDIVETLRKKREVKAWLKEKGVEKNGFTLEKNYEFMQEEQKKKEEVAKWLEEKGIEDSGRTWEEDYNLMQKEKLEKKEERIDTGVDAAKFVVSVVGTAFTVYATARTGGAATASAAAITPALTSAVENCRPLLKGAVNKDMSQVNAAMGDINGNVRTFVMEDANLVKTMNNTGQGQVPNAEGMVEVPEATEGKAMTF